MRARGVIRNKSLIIVLSLAALVTVSGRSVPAQTTTLIYGVTASNRLIGFSPTSPGTVLGAAAITNLASGERILGLDMRPATNQLYAVGHEPALPDRPTYCGCDAHRRSALTGTLG